MFPDPPYAGFSWPITQHMGVITPHNLYHILWAASAYGSTDDPPSNITNYVIVNHLFTPNVRSDSGQPDAWRDYQQILSELGLIISTQVIPKITPTPLGLAYLDGSLSFSALMTLQAFRYQYPNGHKLVIDPRLRSTLSPGTGRVETLVELHISSGVQIRPAVLVWRILTGLRAESEDASLTVDEIQKYLMRCSSHDETEMCLHAIINMRRGGSSLPAMPRGRRNTQDWIKLLSYTPFFNIRSGQNAGIFLSHYGEEHSTEMDNVCSTLEATMSFWKPTVPIPQNRLDWYVRFGSIDVALEIPSDLADQEKVVGDEYPAGMEEDDLRGVGGALPSTINLRDFDVSALGGSAHDGGASTTIVSSYDAGLAGRAHRVHDEMVILIANICQSKGATVRDDPRSVDILAIYEGLEFIVEVKSITSRNVVSRLRYAIGQVFHYDYVRSHTSQSPRRKVVALAANIPPDAWFVPFLNNHLDMDLLSLDGPVLRVDSPSEISRRLFSAVS